MHRNSSPTVFSPETDCLDRSHINTPLWQEVFLYSRVYLDTVIITFTLIANGVLILALAQYRSTRSTSLRRSTASVRFVTNLAASDLLLALSVLWYLITNYFCEVSLQLRDSAIPCLSRYVPACFAQIMSSLSIVSIALDRYFAVFYPLRYTTIMSDRASRIIVALVWIVSFLSSHVLYLWNTWHAGSSCELEDVVPDHYMIILDSAFHFTVLALVAGVHYKLHCKARESISLRSSLAFIPQGQRRGLRSVKVFALVSGVYLVCWTPYCIINIIAVLENEESTLTHFTIRAAYTMRNMYALLNPFIYAWKNKEIQTALRRFLRETHSHVREWC